MDNEKMAKFISDMRREKKLTQKDLADQLGVTDKAVSKWERGLSCPDISLLKRLSDILGVTLNELLDGERGEKASPPKAEELVETTLNYASKLTTHKYKDMHKIVAVIFSFSLILGMLISIICDAAIFGRLTWSLIVISTCVFVWLIVTPILLMGQGGVLLALVSLSVFIIPFIFALSKSMEYYTGTISFLMPISIRVSLISIVFLWAVYFIVRSCKLKVYALVATISLLLILLNYAVNGIVSKYTGEAGNGVWDIIEYSVLAVIGVTTFVVGYIKNKRITNK